MINCEDEIYTLVATALRSEFPDISISGYGENVPLAMPYVSFEMSDNTVLQKVMDSGLYDCSIVYFDINIYSNKRTGRKKECRDIAAVIDDVLFPRNFRRMEMSPIKNKDNPNIYRIFARYRAATDGEFFYRR